MTKHSESLPADDLTHPMRHDVQPPQTYETEPEPSTTSDSRQSQKIELIGVILVVLGVFAALAFGAIFSINQVATLATDRRPAEGQYQMALQAHVAYLTLDHELHAALEARGPRDAHAFKSRLASAAAAASALRGKWLALTQSNAALLPLSSDQTAKETLSRITTLMSTLERGVEQLESDPIAFRRWHANYGAVAGDFTQLVTTVEQLELSGASAYQHGIDEWASRTKSQIMFAVAMLFLTAAAALILGWQREQRRLAAIDQMAREQNAATMARMSAMDEAGASQAVRNTFTNVVAHELRTPMQSIISATDLIEISLSAQGPESMRSALKRIRHAISMMRTQLSDLLEYAKSEDPKLDIRVEPFSPATLAKKIDESYQPIASAKGLEFSVTLTPSSPPTLMGDPMRLSQVINNLVDNAIKYTPAGAVTVALSVTAQGLSVDVADQGIGIDDEDLASIRTPFARGGNVPKDIPGSGLGLAIVDKLVKLMGGTLVVSTVSRVAPRGTRASVHIPLQQWTPENKHILVIDDRLADDFTDMLKQLTQCTPLAATTGRQGLEIASRRVNDIEMILLDIQLPDISGVQVARTLHTTLGDKSPPIVAITAFPDQIAANERDLFAAILEKPVTSRDLAHVRKTLFHPTRSTLAIRDAQT